MVMLSFLLFPFPLEFGGLAFSLWFDLISSHGANLFQKKRRVARVAQIPQVDISTSAFRVFDHIHDLRTFFLVIHNVMRRELGNFALSPGFFSAGENPLKC